ncbi:hypothetical protein ALC60_13196 [Trachymyrmex zeteki]|uniref:Uncharacterized protein n=1 Tax=Mycetomoellerius zeteki TaxID=64791 RepID=A0A151WIY0_9HYME|nr:hypothetical protein ALC60_13196 [Trachymyrmex zeteki]
MLMPYIRNYKYESQPQHLMILTCKPPVKRNSSTAANKYATFIPSRYNQRYDLLKSFRRNRKGYQEFAREELYQESSKSQVDEDLKELIESQRSISRSIVDATQSVDDRFQHDRAIPAECRLRLKRSRGAVACPDEGEPAKVERWWKAARSRTGMSWTDRRTLRGGTSVAV